MYNQGYIKFLDTYDMYSSDRHFLNMDVLGHLAIQVQESYRCLIQTL